MMMKEFFYQIKYTIIDCLKFIVLRYPDCKSKSTSDEIYKRHFSIHKRGPYGARTVQKMFRSQTQIRYPKTGFGDFDVKFGALEIIFCKFSYLVTHFLK